MHDAGKLARPFQEVLRGHKRYWEHRHEVFSLAFLPLVVYPGHPAWASMAAAVATHHRDVAVLAERYPLDIAEALVVSTWQEAFDEEALTWWWEVTCTEAPELLDAAGLEPQRLPLQSLDVEMLHREGGRIILQALEDLMAYARREQQRLEVRQEALLLRGLLIQADRTASAGVCLRTQVSFAGLETLPFTWHAHQQKAASAAGTHLILEAPTGSGKTEAVLRWAAGASPQHTLWYVLPFQASLHAMYERFLHRYGWALEEVGLWHGHVLAFLMEEADEREARYRHRAYRLGAPLLYVTTPYQLLKAAFRLPGYEILWSMLAGARLIMDELHAYEPLRLGLLLAFMEDLVHRWDVRLAVVTATLPGWLKARVQALLPDVQVVCADANLYRRFVRHRVVEGPSTLLDALEAILEAAHGGQKVLVVVNRVDTAVELYLRLREATDRVGLLHGRFTLHDRARHEARLQQVLKAPEGWIQVATQVVEVSLDVDFDVLYTEPAPPEALYQRAGRVNRRGRLAWAPVIVTRQPVRGPEPYDAHLLAAVQEHLPSLYGQPWPEAEMGAWLDTLYASVVGDLEPRIEQGYAAYQEIAGADRLVAFASDPTLVAQFYLLFDGAEVLPEACYRAFVRAREAGQYPKAVGYLVNISRGRFHALQRAGRLTYLREHSVWLASVPYDSERGLSYDLDTSTTSDADAGIL